MYIFKLYILRIILIMVIFVSKPFCSKRYKLPLKWLLHYLVGTGKGLKVPKEVVEEANSALKYAVRYEYNKETHTACVSHSTLYDGLGFYERPTLFYLIGCFTFKVSDQLDENTLLIYGVDRYDWHPCTQWDDYNEEYKTFYFTSPLGHNWFIKFVVKMLDKIFGNELFISNYTIGDSRDCAISNKLWEEMKKVGAKEFYSSFVATVKYKDLEEEYE